MSTVTMMNSPAFWAQQISALSARRTSQALAAAPPGSQATSTSAVGGGLFAELVATLTGGAVTVNGAGTGAATGVTSGASSSTVGRSQIAQDVEAFTQSLSAALASNRAAPVQSGGAEGSAPEIALARVYGHGRDHDGMRSKLESLISSLKDSSKNTAAGRSSAATSPAIANVSSAYSKLMTDIGASSASPTLRGLLQSVLLHVQQQGSWAAASGHVVHAVA